MHTGVTSCEACAQGKADHDAPLSIRSSSTARCKDGDVRAANRTGVVNAGEALDPEIRLGARWFPLCGHSFWDGHAGAATFCKQLGFSGGTVRKVGGIYAVDASPVGKCHAGQKLTACSGGGNAWANFDYQKGYCKAGTKVSVQVSCSGAASGAVQSCGADHTHVGCFRDGSPSPFSDTPYTGQERGAALIAKCARKARKAHVRCFGLRKGHTCHYSDVDGCRKAQEYGPRDIVRESTREGGWGSPRLFECNKNKT